MKTKKAPALVLHFDVAFHQCDPLGVVWHGRWFEWLDVARSRLFAERDLSEWTIREMGHRLFVVDLKCRYMAPFVYGDRVRVEARFSALQPLIRVAYDLYNDETDRWCGRAVTVLATTDAAGELLATTPDALLERLPRR